MKRGAVKAALLLALLAGGLARAQNMISQDGWEGFAMRDTENKFDRCVLYNRSIQALTVSPYQMFGITRDAAGRIGLLIFYAPGMLTRGSATVRLKLDQRPPVEVGGTVLSDFHVNVPSLETATVAALHDAKAIESTVGERTIRFDLADAGAALDKLETCVKTYGAKN